MNTLPINLADAINKLAEYFNNIEWKFTNVSILKPEEIVQLWPGDAREEIMICVFKGKRIDQAFHRQDYFFFNFAYKGNYGALSSSMHNRITVEEGECYIGQPHAGYAPNGESDEEIIIVGVLIQTEVFFKTFLHILSTDPNLFNFFLQPQRDAKSSKYIKLKFTDTYSVRHLLNLMILEYAEPKENTQDVLKALTLALLMLVARQYKQDNITTLENGLPEAILTYMGEHYDTVTLATVAEHFSYHPNYISTLLPKATGKTFSELLLSIRMDRAVALLKGTKLPISEIATLLGYNNSSNFYKAFREVYRISPREYISIKK